MAGGLPSVGITGFTGFGRQSTNPQWQNPALINPKVNYTWVKGNHSLKFGYEYEHLWMAVNDNNPLYGSWTYGGGYTVRRGDLRQLRDDGKRLDGSHGSGFRHLLGRLSVRHHQQLLAGQLLRGAPAQTLQSLYAQDDWKVSAEPDAQPGPALGVRIALCRPAEQHLQLRSGVSQTVLTITPGAATGNGITPVTPAR